MILYDYKVLINKLIINQNLYILYVNEDVKNVFTPAPVISFSSARKLSSYLVVKVKLYPLERTVGSVQCKEKWCQTCHNVKETERLPVQLWVRLLK